MTGLLGRIVLAVIVAVVVTLACILGAWVGYAFAALHITDAMSAWDVERRTRPNVVPLTPREHDALRRHLRQYGNEPLGVG